MRILSLFLLVPLISCSCGGHKSNPQAAQSPDQPVRYTYEVVGTYPHSTSSYTQGLYWNDGYLWEGTGEYGESRLMQVEPESGKAVKSVALGDEFFGEGIALLGGNIYQLTWLNRKGFIYDAHTLARVAEFDYKGEGWGITTDGRQLYVSDGSDKLYTIDPATLGCTDTIAVKLGTRSLKQLNELEWIEGRIWANVYMTDNIVIIDPSSGRVEGVVDLSGLLPQSERTPDTDVLNGIAYDASAKRIFVTGKNWSKLYEIKIKEKQ